MSKLSREELQRMVENNQTAIVLLAKRIEKLEKMHHRCSNCRNSRVKDYICGYCNLDDEPIEPNSFCEKWEER